MTAMVRYGVMRQGTRLVPVILAALLLPACETSAFFGSKEEPEPEVKRPPPAKTASRPPECQRAMDLITSCGIPLIPSRVTAVAECHGNTYSADTELLALLKCLGDDPDCEQLARCSGPIVDETDGSAEGTGAAGKAKQPQ